jgi:ribosomal protein L10
LKGPIGLVIAHQDPVSVAKALQAFGRTNPKFAIRVGLVEGKVLEPAEMRALADLPSKDALRAQLVGALQGPMSQLVTLLTAPQSELVRVLEARSKGSDNSENQQEAI